MAMMALSLYLLLFIKISRGKFYFPLDCFYGGITTYFLTKKKDRESEWRKEKLSYYKAFIESLSRIIEDESTPEGQQQFAQAGNNLLLFAPHDVLKALSAFREEIRTSNKTRTREAHDRLLTQLLLRIRADIGVFPVDDSATFTARLWASGTRAI